MHRRTHEEQRALERSGTTAHPRRTAIAARRRASGSGAARGSLAPVGVALGGDLGHRRRRRAAGSWTYRAAPVARCAATQRAGRGFAARCVGARLPHRVVDAAPRGRGDRAQVRCRALHHPSLARTRAAGLLLPETRRQGARAQRAGHCALEAASLAGAKKNCARDGRVIVFIDESGFSERPTVARTWGQRGHPPIIQYCFNWHQLSAIAGLTFWNFYFRLYPGTVNSARVIEFLKALRAQIQRPLLVIWDRSQTHRSRLVKRFLESLHG